jgi:hypothetical protein
MTCHEMSWGEPAWPADDPGPPEPPLDAQPPINNHHPDTPVLADKVLTRSALRNLPKPEPLIDDTLDRATFALLYGAKSAYKTFVVLDWGLSAATHTSLDVRHGLAVPACLGDRRNMTSSGLLASVAGFWLTIEP